MSNATTPENTGSRKPIHVLSLDGGGVRGLSSLYLLRDLMTRLGTERGITPPGDLRPSDCFDLIVGTGTGGISALFLGRMRMTVDEAIREYLFVAQSAFNPPSSTTLRRVFGRSKAVLDGRALEKSISDVASRFLKDPNALFGDSTENPTCRTAVLAATSARTDAPPHIFRSYSTALPACRFAIHGVAQATAAVGGLFSPVKLGNPSVEFLNSELVNYNNPTNAALDEAMQIWPSAQYKIACIVSLGTGLQKIVQMGGSWKKLVDVSARLIQDSDRVHSALSSRLQIAEMPYFRFNVTHGLDVLAVEWKDPKNQMTRITKEYTSQPDVAQTLQTCVKILKGESTVSTGQELLGSVQNNNDYRKHIPLHHPTPQIFYGRNEQIQNAVGLLLQKEGVCLAILGSSGIGKTSIAKAILHDNRIKSKFNTDCYFISCQSISSSAVLVDTLCDAFSLQIPLANRQNNLVRLLKNNYTSSPLLLILDNFETVWKPASPAVAFLLKCLAEVTGICLIVTMCGTEQPAGLPWAIFPVITHLDPVASHKTFLAISKIKDDDPNLNRLLAALGHIPLAVTLMAHLGQTETPSQLFGKWEKEQSKFLSHPQDQGQLNNVDISITISLESPQVQACPQALHLLSIIAYLPAGIPKHDLHEICPNIHNCNLAVTTLCQLGLAIYDSIQTLHVLAPIRSYILKKYPLTQPFLHDVQSFYFKLTELHDVKNSQQTLHQATGNLETVLTRALLEPSINEKVKIEAALDWSYFLHFNAPRVEIIELALNVAKKNTMQQAMCLQTLGNMCHVLLDYEKAQKILFEAQTEFQSLGDHIGVAQCQESLGKLYHVLHDYPKAKEMHSAAQAGFQSTGHKMQAAHCLKSLGETYRLLDDYPKSQEILSMARTEFQSIDDHMGAALCLQPMGDTYLALGNYPKAKEIFTTAQSEFKSLGYQLGEAQCLKNLGDICVVNSEYPEAVKTFTAAATEFDSLNEHLGIAQCMLSLGDIWYIFANYPLAQKALTGAQAEFQLLDDQLGVAKCVVVLGNVHYKLSDYPKAQELLSTAQTEFEALGHKDGAALCSELLEDIDRILDNQQNKKK